MNYYIADTHFGHKNIIKFDNRPYYSVKDMEESIVQFWNEKVSNHDYVYILGDFCWGKEDEWLRIVNRLNGIKILIRGNHDLKNMSKTLKQCFQYITDYKEINDNGKKVIMSHYPNLFYKNSGDENTWHLCGHTHNRTNEELLRSRFVSEILKQRQYNYDNKGHIINVGCMMPYMAYTPRTLNELIDWFHNYYHTK